jgi:2-polyprenyl-3-methyl-5-hydroxy-6-metoxy-1,4-benzoquinol methylase
MPSEEWNQRTWGNEKNWITYMNGEQWSQAWGGSYAQWYGLILPRIASFLPCNKILEIAPGFGRWTNFLIQNCNHLTGIDISKPCIDFCQTKWGHQSTFIQTSGTTIPTKDKYDFVFSFDSLVHVEYEIIRAYITEILNKLSDTGYAFIHHSNLYEFRKDLPDNIHARAMSVSADHVRSWIQESGGKTVIQEKINWGTTKLIDCFTLFTPMSNSTQQCTTILENNNLMDNASHINQYISPYHKI